MNQSAAAPSAEMLAEITSFLSDRDLYGIVWCGEDLVATHRHGNLSTYVPLGENICESLLPLMGFDEQIKALRRQPDRCVEIPNISIRADERTSPRLNINVYWIAPRKMFVVVLSRVLRRSDLEFELSHQIRAKRIAQHLLAEQTPLLERANRDLRRANDELEEFAYVISHDLNAPLRLMRYLMEDLQQSMETADGAKAEQQLQQIAHQTRRMSAMLSGLFDYATVEKKRDAVEEIDTGALAKEIAASLPLRAGMEIAIEGTWPRLTTLAQPLDLVLRNLMDNAIKHHDRDDGKITVTAEDAGDFIAITVADDGPGIPKNYRRAVFRVFLTVAGGDHPDSSGVGLALVKKSVESIGGTIELLPSDSTDDQTARGTSFKVMWPKTAQV